VRHGVFPVRPRLAPVRARLDKATVFVVRVRTVSVIRLRYGFARPSAAGSSVESVRFEL
jgi:hypothetical protein